MTLNINNVFVFKTNIQTPGDQVLVGAFLNTHRFVDEWSIDTEDIDCVLRVVSEKMTAEEIIEQVSQAGFDCTELE